MIKSMRLVLQVETIDGRKFEGGTRVFYPLVGTIEDTLVFKTMNDVTGRPETEMESLVKHLVSAMRNADRLGGEKDLLELCEGRLLLELPSDIREGSIEGPYSVGGTGLEPATTDV